MSDVEVIEVLALSSVLGLRPGEVRILPIDTPELLDVIRVGHAVRIVNGVPLAPPAPPQRTGGCGCGG